jgi:hypothetical protein
VAVILDIAVILSVTVATILTVPVILTATVTHAGHEGYSYSCLTEVPEPGFVGVAYETVLPGSSIVHGVSYHRLII